MGYNSCMYQPYRPYAVSRRNKKPEEGVHLLACRYMKVNYPELDFLTDYAAGLHMTIAQAKKRKAMNSGRGWTDITILKPSRGYYGFLTDIKKEGTAIYVTKGPRKGQLVADPHIQEQAAFMERMTKLGYFCRFSVGYENFCRLLDWYMEKEQSDSPF